VIVGMRGSTLQHKEVAMLCEENMITTKARNALLVPHNTKHTTLIKHKVIHERLTNIA
jgi:hypothetical protein